MVHKFFDKKSKGSGIKNQQLANELHNPNIKKILERKSVFFLKDNI